MRLAWERLRARRKPGTAIAASRAIMATTIMISTRVKALRDFDRETFILREIISSRRANISTVDTALKTAPAMPKLNPDDYHSMASFRHLVRKFLRFSKELVKTTAGLNSEQYEELLAIKAFTSNNALTTAELSERLRSSIIPPSTLLIDWSRGNWSAGTPARTTGGRDILSSLPPATTWSKDLPPSIAKRFAAAARK